MIEIMSKLITGNIISFYGPQVFYFISSKQNFLEKQYDGMHFIANTIETEYMKYIYIYPMTIKKVCI